jgi:hypothetical protein
MKVFTVVNDYPGCPPHVTAAYPNKDRAVEECARLNEEMPLSEGVPIGGVYSVVETELKTWWTEYGKEPK